MNKIHVEYLDVPYIGSNGKYNYFYKIVCKTNNEYYYGIHVTQDLDDNYLGSGRLLNKRYKEIDIKLFTKFILKFFNDTESVFEYEKKIINHDLIKDKLCLNCMPGGRIFESNLNKKHIHYNDKSILVNENLLQEYLDNGWKLGRLIDIHGSNNPSYGKRWLHKNGKNKYVYESEIENYLNDGYEFGIIKKSHQIKNNNAWVNNGNINKIINKNELKEYINKGWKKGRTKNKKYTKSELNHNYWVNKDGKNTRVTKDKLEEYINNGWKNGRCNYKRK